MLFSIILPIYKVEDYLTRCIDSILDQNFDDFEMILVDDVDNRQFLCKLVKCMWKELPEKKK